MQSQYHHSSRSNLHLEAVLACSDDFNTAYHKCQGCCALRAGAVLPQTQLRLLLSKRQKWEAFMARIALKSISDRGWHASQQGLTKTSMCQCDAVRYCESFLGEKKISCDNSKHWQKQRHVQPALHSQTQTMPAARCDWWTAWKGGLVKQHQLTWKALWPDDPWPVNFWPSSCGLLNRPLDLNRGQPCEEWRRGRLVGWLIGSLLYQAFVGNCTSFQSKAVHPI